MGVRGRLEESARGAAEQTAGMGEQHQKTQDDAADAIAAQMTTLGLELATWPTAPTLHAALDRLERLAATTCVLQGEPRQWDEHQLGAWLVRLGLPESIARTFEANLVNGQVAMDLNEGDLAAMGMNNAFHQCRVLRELQELLAGGGIGGRAGAAGSRAKTVEGVRRPLRAQSARGRVPTPHVGSPRFESPYSERSRF